MLMNWKEFIVPRKEKIILALILFLLLPVPFSSPVWGGPAQCEGEQTCELGTKMILAPFGGVFFITSIFVSGNDVFETMFDYIWKVPYLIILSYVLSCALFYIFGITKKRSIYS